MNAKRAEETVYVHGQIFGVRDSCFWVRCLASAAQAEDKITIGFVTHSQGDPFIQQIIDGAQAAANDLGVTLKVAQQQGAAPDGQLKLVQNIVNAGAQGVATSVPGDSMAGSLNDIIASGVPVVQFNLLSAAVKAPYVGEKSTQSGRILGKAIVDKTGGAGAKGKVIIGNCFPGLTVLENRARGVEELLKSAPGIAILGPVRCEGQRGRKLQSLGTALRGQSRCGRSRRTVRS